MPKEKPLSQVVREWRSENGLNIAAAATILGIPSRTLEGIEQGRPFRYEKLLRFAIKGVD